MVFFGIGQSDFMWYLRGLPQVKAAFAALWGTNDLLVSFDGGVTFRSQDPTLVPSDGYWWHVDQSPRLMPKAECMQGILTLTASDPDVGGLVLIDASHKYFPSFYEDRYGDVLDLAPQSLNYFAIPSWDPEAHKHLANHAVQPHLEAGDLIIWDSRTLHCSRVGQNFSSNSWIMRSHLATLGLVVPQALESAQADSGPITEADTSGVRRTPGYRLAKASASSLLRAYVGAGRTPEQAGFGGARGPQRLGAFITMTPRSKASAETLLKRRRAVCEGTTTTHWPHYFVDAQEHNAQNWDSMSEARRNRFQRPPPPRLSASQLRLVGYTEEELVGIAGDQGAGCAQERGVTL